MPLQVALQTQVPYGKEMKLVVALTGLTALLAVTGATASGGDVSSSKLEHKLGRYSGQTSEPAPVFLVVERRKVDSVGVTGKANCTDVNTGEKRSLRLRQRVAAGYYGNDQLRVWALDGRGRFDGTAKDRSQVRGKNAFELRVSGKVKGRRISGTVGYKLESEAVSCVFGPRRFTAKWVGRSLEDGPSPRR
jgi:hypothetical protein